MRDRLKDRIEEFAKSLDRVHFLDRALHIQRFIETELVARDTEYTLTAQDLANIHSSAVQHSISSTHNPKDSKDLALFWVIGVTNWLRSKDMLYFVIGAKESKDEHINKKRMD